MELRHLRYFIRAAELLHFTRAAESLYISQPALSAQIKQLEDELGVQLFARVGRNVRLTEAGELFVSYARKAVQSIEKGEEELGALEGLLRGNVRVVVIPEYGSIMLPELIVQFQERYPNVHFKLSASISDSIERNVAAGHFDLGITLLPLERNDLASFELFADEIVLAVSSCHHLSKEREVVPSALNELPLALSTQQLLHVDGMKFLREHNVEPKVMVELEERTAVVNLVRTGKLATLMPRSLVPDDLVHLKLAGSGPTVRLCVVWSHLSPAAHEFLQMIKMHFESQNSSPSGSS
jgi:LysR family transcriptional regulator, cyn operon transcriptional activator